jgi:hypothetical protein
MPVPAGRDSVAPMADWDGSGRTRGCARLEALVDDDGSRGRRPEECAACRAERDLELAWLRRIQAGLREVRIPAALRQRILASLREVPRDDTDDLLRGN